MLPYPHTSIFYRNVAERRNFTLACQFEGKYKRLVLNYPRKKFGHSFSIIFIFDIHFPSHLVIFTTVTVYKSNLSSNKMYYRTIPNDTQHGFRLAVETCVRNSCNLLQINYGLWFLV